MWVIPTITEDNGRSNRYTKYTKGRSSTGSNLVNYNNYSLNGGDVVWGTSPYGGPYTKGVVTPFVDGSFDTTLTDNQVGAVPVTTPAPVAGADIAVLGNILYMGGYTVGQACVSAFSVGTGRLLGYVPVHDETYLPNTLIAFKEGTDITGSAGGPTDGIFVVTDGGVSTFAIVPGSPYNFTLNSSGAINGSWPGARGVFIPGDDQINVGGGGGQAYASVGVWTDPTSGNLYGADVVNGAIGLTTIYALGGTPRAICLDKETNSVWVVQESSRMITQISINMAFGYNLEGLAASSFSMPGTSSNIDDLLFDGAYLWGIAIANSTYYQFTPNGFVVSYVELNTDTNYRISMSSDSRLYFDGSLIYITGLINGGSLGGSYTSAVCSVHPGTGRPVEYFTFPTFASRGVAFRGDDMFVATGPTINTDSSGGAPNSPNINTGIAGSIAGSVGFTSAFSDPSANWGGFDIGKYIHIYNTSIPSNSGLYQILSIDSPTQIEILSSALSSDPNNGFLPWQMYMGTCGIQRMTSEPPGTDFGVLDSIMQTPAITGWGAGARLGARVVEYTGYASAQTFSMTVAPLPGTKVLFVDKDGLAGTYPLTITTSVGTINGQSSYALVANYGYVELEWDGSLWLVVRETTPQGYAYLSPFGSPYTMTAIESAATTVVISSGGEFGDFTVVSLLPPTPGILKFLRNISGHNVTFQFSIGGGVTFATGTSALITSDGANAVLLMAGT